MKSKVYICLNFLILFPLINSCTQLMVANCQESDWYELGRRDGANGAPVRYETKKTCNDSDIQANEVLYRNGRYAGLIEYCGSENGFEIGKSGNSYYFVCPTDMESGFLKQYRMGKRFFELEKQNQNIEKSMHTMAAELKNFTLNAELKSSVKIQIYQLKQQRSRNLRELANIESLIN